MGFLGLFKHGKKESSEPEPEFLKKIDVEAATDPELTDIKGEVEPELALWLSNGTTARSLKELAAAMKKMSAKDYKENANPEKNEIAEWVQEILNNSQLAKQLRKAKNKQQAAKLVEKESKATARRNATLATKTPKSRKTKSSDESLPDLPEFPPMPGIAPMPEEVEKAPLIGMAEEENAEMALTNERKLQKPHLNLWPFSRKKAAEQEKPEEKMVAAGPLEEAEEAFAEEKKIQPKAKTKKATKAEKKAMAKAARQMKLKGQEKAVEEPQPLPELSEKMPWEEPMPELPEEQPVEFEEEKLQILPLEPAEENLELPVLPEIAAEASQPKEPKGIFSFFRKAKRKEEPAKLMVEYESIPEINQADMHAKKIKFGTYLQKGSQFELPELEDKTQEQFEPEPHHAKWDESSVMEENDMQENTPAESPETEADSMRVEDNAPQAQWKPNVYESASLVRQARDIEKIEQIINKEEEDLNNRRLELTRRRYDLIKQKGDLERRRFEDFMSRHKLATPTREIVRKAKPEQSALPKKAYPGNSKGMPDFRLAGAYGKERLEELLEQAKEHISDNNIAAAKKALDEVSAVFSTVYMTASEKQQMKYEILELEADLKLATLN